MPGFWLGTLGIVFDVVAHLPQRPQKLTALARSRGSRSGSNRPGIGPDLPRFWGGWPNVALRAGLAIGSFSKSSGVDDGRESPLSMQPTLWPATRAKPPGICIRRANRPTDFCGPILIAPRSPGGCEIRRAKPAPPSLALPGSLSGRATAPSPARTERSDRHRALRG